MKIKVFKDGWDWMWECEEHRENCYCTDWALAYEGAMGHACMHHPWREICKHEIGFKTNKGHHCFGCGMDLDGYWDDSPGEPCS